MEFKFKSVLKSSSKLSDQVNLSYKELYCSVIDNSKDASIELKIKAENGTITKNELVTSGLNDTSEKLALTLQKNIEKYFTSSGGGGDLKLEIKISRKV